MVGSSSAARFAVVAATAILLTCPASSRAETLRLSQLISAPAARQFMDTIEWQRYEATRINIAEEEAWEDPAIFLDLKGDDWNVVFPNDEFLSQHRRLFGDIANPRSVKGDVKEAALELLDRYLVKVYRVRIGGPDSPDRAVVFTPYTIKALTIGDTIKIALDDNGLHTREGDLTGGDSELD